jgi:hypothetical protein
LDQYHFSCIVLRLADFQSVNYFCDADNDDSNVAYDMQDKLLAVWEMLSTSAMSRMEYICKYSTSAYSTELTRAIDMLAVVAVQYVAINHLFSIHKKLKVTKKLLLQ